MTLVCVCSFLIDWCVGGVEVVAWADGGSKCACSNIMSVSGNMDLYSCVCILFLFRLVPLLIGTSHIFCAVLQS